MKNCLTCSQLERVPSKNLKTHLQTVSSPTSFAGEILQNDLADPWKSPVHCCLCSYWSFYKLLICCLFAEYQSRRHWAWTYVHIFRHSHLPKNDSLWSGDFRFWIDAWNNEILLEHASLKHPQTVRVVERFHIPLERIPKFNTNEPWNDWCKYVQLATFIHNLSCHSAISCSPTVLFHGQESLKPLDFRFSNT